MKRIRWSWNLVWMVMTLSLSSILVIGCGSTGAVGARTTNNTQPTTTLSSSQSTVQFGNVPVGTAVTQTLTFTNPAGSASSVVISSVQVSGSGFSLPQAPTLPITVVAGQSASVVVQALPSAAGPLTGTLTVTSNATPATITINLSATGVTTTGTTFSVTGTVTPAAQVLGATVTLTGSGITPSTVTVDSNGNFTFAGLSNGTYTLSVADGSATFSPATQQVTVSGANVTGITFAETFSISGSLGTAGSGATVTLSGPATATVTADASGNFSFGGLANGTYTITPTKSGVTFTPASLQVTINNASVSGSGVTFTETFSISGTITPASVGAGATVSLTGAATQQATADANGNFVLSGLANGSYTLTPKNGSTTFVPASQAVTINGASVTGVAFAANGQLSMNPSSLTFSSINVGSTSAAQTVTLNATGGAVTITSDTLTGSGFGLSGLTFPTTIASGGSATFSVTFAPTVAGSASGTLSFNNASTVLASENLSGTGAGLSLSSSSLAFGQVEDGASSAAQSVTLTAVGGGVTISAANLVQSGGGGSAFSVTGLPAMPFTLAAGLTAQASVSFAPAAGSPGAASGTLTFSSNINGPALTLGGTGTSNVSLTWSASTTPNVTYNVYRCSISAAACVQGQPSNFTVVAGGVGALTYTDASVSSGQTYYYALTAVDSTGAEGTLSGVSSSAAIP